MSRIPTIEMKREAFLPRIARTGGLTLDTQWLSSPGTLPLGPGAVEVPRVSGRAAEEATEIPVAAPAWKRALDIVCILLALPLLLPVAGLIALLIKCVSRGPVLYRQERVGYRGRRFICLKFRTMFTGTSTAVYEEHCRRLIASDAPMLKMDDAEDRRIIPFGPVLRSMGLDELPQLINVLRGEMSLVGPRPCLPAEYDAYRPEHRGRVHALPGLTGLWQVSGKNSTSFSRMVELDIEYIRRRSLWRDLTIMVRTVPVVLGAVARALRRRLARLRLSVPSLWRRGRLSAG